MENDKTIKEHISKIVMPIFDKALSSSKSPQETNINHTMVVKPHNPSVTPSLYNPHNYRLYFSFTKTNFNPQKGMVGVWSGKFINYNKNFTALGEGVRVTIRKTKAELIHKFTEQEWFFINKAKAKEEISALLNKIDEKCKVGFKKFIETYGGYSDFEIVGKSGRPFINLFNESDNKVMKEKFIDSLPLNLKFETPIVKKVYNEPNVEFKRAIEAANYLENSALNEFSPVITQELNLLRLEMTGLKEISIANTKAINYIAENYKSHVGLVEKGLKVFKLLNKRLSQTNLRGWL